MDWAAAVTVVIALALLGYLLYRLMRWARRRTGGAHFLGTVLSEVTQSAAVQEAKRGNKREERSTGDPRRPGARGAARDSGDE